MKQIATVTVVVAVYVESDDCPRETVNDYVRRMRAYDLRAALTQGVMDSLDWTPAVTLGSGCTIAEGE